MSRWKRFARRMLFSSFVACLSVAAEGSTIIESGDFSNDVNAPTVLPGGVDKVFGGLNGQDQFDVFMFTGLVPNSVTTFLLSKSSPVSTYPSIVLYDESGTGLGSLEDSTSVIISITIPVTGNVNVVAVCACNSFMTSATYGVEIVPEPSTFMAVGLGFLTFICFVRRKSHS